MRIKIIFFSLLAFIAFSCNEEENIQEEIPSGQSQLVTLAVGAEDVTVLIFGKEEDEFFYKKSVSSGWNAEGENTVNLKYGDYKCLFYKYTGQSIKMLPESISDVTSIDDIEFEAIIDEDRAGDDDYVLPVAELWLPENIDDANLDYTIPSVTIIENTLTRAVSQVVVHIKKNSSDNANSPIFSSTNDGTPIDLGDLQLDISGVGTSFDLTGAQGLGKTFFQTSQAIPNDDGSVTYYGPFVFPSSGDNVTSVELTFNANEESTLPSIPVTTINGPLERNKKLEITLTLKTEKPVDGELQVELSVVDMEDNTNIGDSGIWE